jgi:hypothetical protein
MTEEEILNTYGIEFVNKVTVYKRAKRIWKIANSHNNSLAMFLTDWNSITEINEDLLPVIDEVLNGEVVEGRSDSEFIWVELGYLYTKFWWMRTGRNINTPPSYSIPTEHFKVIVAEWRDFLMKR